MDSGTACSGPVAALLFLLAAPLPVESADFRITEFMAANESGIEDEDGNRSDWIEIENAGVEAASLDGWLLTDDPESPAQWRFPDVTVEPGQRVVVFASGKDRRIAGGELHTNFQLAAGGEYLALRAPAGVTPATEFAPAFPPQRPDVSFGIGREVSELSLVTGESAAKLLVPRDGALGGSWTTAGFDDGAWKNVSAAIGYQDGGFAGSPGDPIAYWSFDRTPADGTGNGHDAVLVGCGYGTAAPAVASSTASLDLEGAERDYATIAIDVSESAYTSSLWFRTTNPNAGIFTVVDADLGGGGHDRHLYLSSGNIAARTWNNETIASSGRALADGRWHHVAHVFGGTVGGQRIYVDGQLVASGAKANSDFDWQKRVNIGFSNDASAQHFTGQIDEVAVWSEALTPAQVAVLAAGASPLALGGYAPYIESDIGPDLEGVNASAYLRVPFAFPADFGFDRLELKVRYDDGFVAWLNGTEVARRNAPAVVVHDSAATVDRAVTEGILRETIDLTAHGGRIEAGANVLAIQLLNRRADSAECLMAAELAALDVREETRRYFSEPTPGEPNALGVEDFVADTVFDHDRGFYDEPFTVTVTTETPGATIIYTTDGRKPAPGVGTEVPAADPLSPPRAEVRITGTTTLRAAAFRDGFQPTNVDTQTYLFIEQVKRQPDRPAGYPTSWSGGFPADYGIDPDVVNSTLPGYGLREALLDIPTISVVTDRDGLFGAANGIYYNSASARGRSSEREVSIELIHPDGSDGFQIDGGLRMHGNSSRGHGFTPKHPMRLYFRREYGAAKLRYRVFDDSPLEEFDHLLLRGCSTDSFPVIDGAPRWINDKGTYIRDQYMRDAMRDMGHVSPHGRYVHLYLNGLYWGVYNLAERPTAAFCEAYFGADKDEFDVIKDFAEVNNGNIQAWNAMMGLASAGLSSDAAYQRFLGNDPDGTRNPSFPVHLHLDSFIDYMILHIASGAEDWPDHNYWSARLQGPGSDGFRFFSWDQEISNDDLNRTRSVIFPAQPFESVNSPNSPAFLYDRLRRNATFQQRFRDRVHALFLNGGPLAPESNRARWAARQREIDKAIVGESARWGDSKDSVPHKRETKWMREMDWMQQPGGFWDQIFPKQIQRFRNVGLYPSIDAPEISHPGGPVPAGFPIAFASDGGTVHYTLDGSDPLGADGRPSPTSRAFSGGVVERAFVATDAVWKYLDDGSDQGVAWRVGGFDDSGWAAGPAPLGYGDGDEATVVGFGDDPTNRPITTYFRHAFEVEGAEFVTGLVLRVLRDDGVVVFLNGIEVARSNVPASGGIAFDTPASSNAIGADESTFFYEFPLPAGLLVEGTNTVAAEVHQVTAASSDLSFNLELRGRQPSVDEPVRIDRSATVRARTLLDGEWSGTTSARFLVGEVPASADNLVVSEVHYHPAPPTTPSELAQSSDPDAFEFIEVMNVAAEAVDLSGVEITEGIRFAFTGGGVTRLEPGAVAVVVKNAAAFEARYGGGIPVAGEFANGTGLANGGERVVLAAADRSIIRDFAFDDAAPWPTTPDGGGPSLALVRPSDLPDHADPGSWVASATAGGSPGSGGAASGYDAWAREWFDPDAPDFTEVSAPGRDLEGDGIPNLLEFLLGGSPIRADAASLVTLAVEPDGGGRPRALVLAWRQRAGEGSILVPEWARSLDEWDVVPADAGERTSVPMDDGFSRESLRFPIDEAGVDARFLRLRASP